MTGNDETAATQPEATERENRIAFAANLREFADQREWYSARARSYKKNAQRIDVAIIVFGATVAALPVVKPFGPVAADILIALLGVAIVVVQGIQRVYRYSEIWPEYRFASERMKREWRLFINAAEPYATDEADARTLYIQRLDGIMADEQKIFLDTQRESRRGTPKKV